MKNDKSSLCEIAKFDKLQNLTKKLLKLCKLHMKIYIWKLSAKQRFAMFAVFAKSDWKRFKFAKFHMKIQMKYAKFCNLPNLIKKASDSGNFHMYFKRSLQSTIFNLIKKAELCKFSFLLNLIKNGWALQISFDNLYMKINHRIFQMSQFGGRRSQAKIGG